MIGWPRFAHKHNYRSLVQNNYFQSMFIIMDHWKVLPTDERFKSLNNDQLNLLLYGLEEQARQAKIAAQSGSGSTSTTMDNDISWLDDPDFSPTGDISDNDFDKQLDKFLADDSNEVIGNDTGDGHEDDNVTEQKRLAQKTLSNTLKQFKNKGKKGV